MTTLLRFRDLQQRNIINSWAMLKRRVANDRFPPGRLIGSNRVWTDEEIDEWVKSWPIGGQIGLRGVAADPTKRGRGRPRKVVAETQAAKSNI